MCGIIGYIGPESVVPILIDGLHRLEYRGYDSAGIAFVENGFSKSLAAGKNSIATQACLFGVKVSGSQPEG